MFRSPKQRYARYFRGDSITLVGQFTGSENSPARNRQNRRRKDRVRARSEVGAKTNFRSIDENALVTSSEQVD
jgi:hypothetical protein